jgi:hypothetical protein
MQDHYVAKFSPEWLVNFASRDFPVTVNVIYDDNLNNIPLQMQMWYPVMSTTRGWPVTWIPTLSTIRPMCATHTSTLSTMTQITSNLQRRRQKKRGARSPLVAVLW